MMHQGLQRDYVALVGMGGVGKSELAAQYVKKHQNDYGGITWFNARDNLAGEVLGFFSLELGLELPEHLKVSTLQKQIAWFWLQYPPSPLPILIIFDDVTKLEQLQQAIPNDNRFRVLVTTRIQNLDPNFIQQISLDVLSPEKEPGKALALLQNLLGKKDKRINTEPEAAKEICKLLEYLPLGIILVGSYLVKDPGLSLTKTLERLRKQKLEEEALQDRETLNQKQLGVKAAFNLTWQELDTKTQQLGAFLGLFSPQFILWVLVVLVIEYKAEDEGKQIIWTEEELNTAKKQLYQRNLLQQIEDTEEAYKIHALVRWFLQEKLAESGEIKLILERTFVKSIICFAKKIPYILTEKQIKNFSYVVSNLEDLGQMLKEEIEKKTKAGINLPPSILPDEVIWIFEGVGRFYVGQELYQLAEIWYNESVKICNALFTSDHRDLATSLNNLSFVYEKQGKYITAEHLLLEALKMRKHLFTDDNLDIAYNLQNLAFIYKAQGRYTEVEPLYVEALKIFKRIISNDHADIAQTLNNLGELYREQKRYTEAENLYIEALEMRKRLFTSDHPDVAQSLNSLGLLYYDLAFLDNKKELYIKAETLYIQALKMLKRLFVRDSSIVATTLNNLGLLYNSQGLYKEAKLLYLQALDMRKRLFKGDHRDVAQSLNNLGLLYYKQRRYNEAKPLYVQALGMFERVLGFEHPNTVTVRENLRLLQQQETPVYILMRWLGYLLVILILPFCLLWRLIKSIVIWCWRLSRR